MKRVEYKFLTGAFFLSLGLALSSSQGAAQEATFVTFNTGLAHGHVLYADNRIGPVVDVLKNNTADVACVQEVWGEKDRDHIIESLKSEYPYAAFAANPVSLKPRCSIFKLAPALACVQKKCTGGETSGDTLSCGMQYCADGIMGLGNDCFSCISHYFPIKSALGAAGTCLARGTNLVFEGQNGLLLLSKYPINDVKQHKFASTMVQRDVIEAGITLPGSLKTKVLCTHLQNNSTAPYFGSLKDWKYEQSTQIKQLTDIAIADPSYVDKTFIMGDMNTGPIAIDIDGEFPENFTLFKSAGFNSLYLASGGRDCTWCGRSNPITNNKMDNIIDHIFMSDAGLAKLKAIDSEIFGQRLYSITVKDPASKVDFPTKLVDTPASDHYGLKVKVKF